MINSIPSRFKKIKITRKKIIILIILGLLTTGGTIAYQRNNQPQPLQFTQVKKTDIKSIVSASGTLNGKNTTDLKFRSSGKLAYLNVKVGDQVWAGENIAGLDTQDLNIKLQQAQNTLTDKQATLTKTLDDIHLFQYGNGGFSNVGTSNETATQRQARISAEEAVNNAYDSVKEAQRAFQDSVIISPYNGVITQVKVVPGQSVSGSDIVATVSANSEVYFDADVDQADITKVSIGQNGEIILDSYPEKTFKGSVFEIQGQTKTTGNNATVINVRIKFSDNPTNFISGLTGQISITTEEAKNSLSLPLEAIREDNTVVLQTAGRLKSEKVEVGIKSDTEAQILSGLKEGDSVVLNPPANLNSSQNPNPILRFIRLPGFGGGTAGRPGQGFGR